MLGRSTSSGPWKPSAFNILLRQRERAALFNGASSQILRMTPRQLGALESSFQLLDESGDLDSQELLDCLVALGFVVRRDENEYERERQRYLAHRSGREKLLLTIAPTMACNLRCTYCFQQELNRGRSMSSEIQSGLIDFFRRSLDGVRAVLVQWFGGEPLLALEQICSLSESFEAICRERGIGYSAELLTNGTLLTPEAIECFRQLAIGAVQIPLDGRAETYAARKNIRIERAQAHYETILGSVPSIIDATGSLTVRINVDRDNAGEARELVGLFKARGLTDPRIDFRLGFLNTSRGVVECIPHNCLTQIEFADLEQEFRRFLAGEGYRVYGIPETRDYPCLAGLHNGFTVDSRGMIGKCVPATGSVHTVFSRIYPHDIERTMRETRLGDAPFADFDPFVSERCQDCKLLPVCLGSCPKLHEPGAEFSCSLKEGLVGKLLDYSEFDHELLA